ncbi:hypothetical protein NC653_022651 [Populus alba x Populus x berolinensis]|uniref:Uncharacterized protein n=1 Tax=Populus alba x Populus x berolinensis TaxID=444605 RepID=A0AAD6MF96_9ROSI|nr:hypothetical protein NC653_022651 [Populus alba x Populus x berolinensis]
MEPTYFPNNSQAPSLEDLSGSSKLLKESLYDVLGEEQPPSSDHRPPCLAQIK